MFITCTICTKLGISIANLQYYHHIKYERIAMIFEDRGRQGLAAKNGLMDGKGLSNRISKVYEVKI
jgi:hypothetical protein